MKKLMERTNRVNVHCRHLAYFTIYQYQHPVVIDHPAVERRRRGRD